MILIIGGAYQGKLNYALQRFALGEEDVFHCSDSDVMTPQGRRIIYGLESWLLALIDAKREISTELTRFMELNEQGIVIACDISAGIVPLDTRLRYWREVVSRSLVELSSHSEEVVRLFCGIATKIK